MTLCWRPLTLPELGCLSSQGSSIIRAVRARESKRYVDHVIACGFSGWAEGHPASGSARRAVKGSRVLRSLGEMARRSESEETTETAWPADDHPQPNWQHHLRQRSGSLRPHRGTGGARRRKTDQRLNFTPRRGASFAPAEMRGK
jgi:hypothetical protein